MTYAVAVLALLLPLFASVPPSPAAPSPSPRAPAAAAGLTPEQAQALVKEIGAAVEEIRGLKFKTPVEMEVVDSQTATAGFKAKINPHTEQTIVHTQHAYVQLGLVPHSTNLLSEFFDAAERDVLGYYEPGSKKFYLMSHVPAEEVRGVIAHELTHALEDQHYDLHAVAAKAEGDDDRATAISTVVEGSAMVVMMAYLSQGRGLGRKAAEEAEKKQTVRRARRLKRAPSFTQRSLILPYAVGATFLLRGKPWEWFFDGVRVSDIEQAYTTPPRSTRQVLHPEQYWLGRSRPQANPIELPDLSRALGEGWSKATDGSIGELGLAVLTGAKLDIESPEVIFPARWTNRAATGLLADLFHHYVNGDRRVTVLVTRWETDADATEFDEALVQRGRYLVRYNTSVLLVAGEAGDRGEALAIAAFQGVRYWPGE